MEKKTSSLLVRSFESMKRQKVNFYTNFKERLRLVELLTEKPCSVAYISRSTGMADRSVHRHIKHLRDTGWIIKRPGFGKYQITGVPEDFSQMIDNVFYMIHKIQRSN